MSQPQTFEEWWAAARESWALTETEWEGDVRAVAWDAWKSAIASQQAIVDGFRTKIEAFTADRENLFAQLAEAKAEVERLSATIARLDHQYDLNVEDSMQTALTLRRYEAVVEAAREVLTAAGFTDHDLRADETYGPTEEDFPAAYPKLRAALAALEEKP